MSGIERHGRARYRRGCRCDQCKCAKSDYQRARRRRISESVGLFAEPVTPCLVLLPPACSRSLTSVNALSAATHIQQTPLGAVVTAVMAEIEAMGTNRRPGLAAAAVALAEILDNPRAVSSQPAAAKVLVALLEKLRSPSARGRGGNMAVVRSLTSPSVLFWAQCRGMDRIWQWAWDRYGARYSWAIWVALFASLLPPYLVWSFIVVAYEKSSRFAEAAIVTGVAVVVLAFVVILPGSRRFRLAERWAAGGEVDRARALKDTYTWAHAAGVRGLGFMPVAGLLVFVVVGVIAGASGSRLVQYGALGFSLGIAIHLIGMHAFVEGALRPARAALGGDTGFGDALPRSPRLLPRGRPSRCLPPCSRSPPGARCWGWCWTGPVRSRCLPL